MTDLANLSLDTSAISDQHSVSLTEMAEKEQPAIHENTENCSSNFFNSYHNSNQLIAAAAPLFSLMIRYRKKGKLTTDKTTLFNALRHEIMAFTNKIRQANYRHNITLVARYMMCAFLDETISASAWGEKHSWLEENLLQFFYKETDSEERFFILIDQAYKDVSVYLDLVELAYLCLKLGFMGKYRNREDGITATNKISELLYVAITKHRGENKMDLFV